MSWCPEKPNPLSELHPSPHTSPRLSTISKCLGRCPLFKELTKMFVTVTQGGASPTWPAKEAVCKCDYLFLHPCTLWRIVSLNRPCLEKASCLCMSDSFSNSI
jgi:hypothetical protein